MASKGAVAAAHGYVTIQGNNYYTSSTNIAISYSNTGALTTGGNSIYSWAGSDDTVQVVFAEQDIINIRKNGPIKEIRFPDGSVIYVNSMGNYRIEDSTAKRIYEANNNLAFNPCINAGDMLARFIDYVRTIPGVKRKDVASLPLELFVNWLILEAASRDGDDPPTDVVPVEKSKLLKGRINPQCQLPNCRKFIKRAFVASGFNYCNDDHAARHHALLLVG